MLVVRALFDQQGLWEILDQHLGRAKGIPFADRVFVLVVNRLIAPAGEHGLAGWLETDFVCDRKGRRFLPHWHQRRRVRVHPRQLDAWYLKRPEKIGAAVERIMQKYHGYRYFDWKLGAGSLEFSESKTHLEREEKIEGIYVIATSEKGLSVLDAVAM